MFDKFNELLAILIENNFKYILDNASADVEQDEVTDIVVYSDGSSRNWGSFKLSPLVITIDFIYNNYNRSNYIEADEYTPESYNYRKGEFVYNSDSSETLYTNYPDVFDSETYNKLKYLYVDTMIDTFPICPVNILVILDDFIITRMHEKNYISNNYDLSELAETYSLSKIQRLLPKEVIDIFMF